MSDLHVEIISTTDEDWASVRRVRQVVFVEEQDCPPDQEWDGYDEICRHLIGRVGDEVVATARWRAVEHDGRTMAKLERFAVLETHRGRGYGRKLVEAALSDARGVGHDVFFLHAQAHLEDFYASFGFESTGRHFTEVGIPHVEMIMDTEPHQSQS